MRLRFEVKRLSTLEDSWHISVGDGMLPRASRDQLSAMDGYITPLAVTTQPPLPRL